MVEMTATGMRLYAFIVLCAVLSQLVVSETTMACKHNGMWGDVNPNVFYICDPETNTPLQLRCPEGRGFFNGLGYYGCIPFEDWPACIPTEVRHQQDNGKKVPCDSEHLLEPWQTSDPNKFYMCTDAALEPVLVNCEIGKGFLSVPTEGGTRSGSSKIVGCAAWSKWRSYMQCEQYY